MRGRGVRRARDDDQLLELAIPPECKGILVAVLRDSASG